jgi:hypothetical protein
VEHRLGGINSNRAVISWNSDWAGTAIGRVKSDRAAFLRGNCKPTQLQSAVSQKKIGPIGFLSAQSMLPDWFVIHPIAVPLFHPRT